MSVRSREIARRHTEQYIHPVDTSSRGLCAVSATVVIKSRLFVATRDRKGPLQAWFGTVVSVAAGILAGCGGGDTTPTYSVGGRVQGLSGSGLVLALSGGESLSVSGNGPFQFATLFMTSASYSVTVKSQPTTLPTLLCSVSEASGEIGSANVTNVVVSCATPAIALLAGQLGGSGNLDGQGSLARFDGPQSIGVDGDGTLYVADARGTTIRKITSDGLVTTIAGQWQVFGFADGTGAAARFNEAIGLAANGTDGVYLADTGNQVIRKVSASGVVTTIAGQPGVPGSLDGLGSAAQFNSPGGVVLDAKGNLYVGDSGNDTIRKITPDGGVTTFTGQPGTQGETNGNVSVATFYQPGTLAIDSSGSLYVSDVGNGVVRKITGTTVTTVPAAPPDLTRNAPPVSCLPSFCGPVGIAVDSAGIYVTDFWRDQVYLISPTDAVQIVAGPYTNPFGLAVDAHGDLYVADSAVIREMSPSGAFSTFAGAPQDNGFTDGPAAQAQFSQPAGIVRDSQGNLFIADNANNTLRKITPDGTVSTFAGQASTLGGYQDGTGSAARFRGPWGIAIDAADNLYVTDGGNNMVRRVTPSAAVTTLVGSPKTTGVACGGTLCLPYGIVMDATGNLYVGDWGSNTIRKITPAGVVTIFAGSAGVKGSADGVGAAARFNGPVGLGIDAAGNIYVADSQNDTVRAITPGASVTTLAGSPGVVGNQDGTGSAATFDHAGTLASDAAGNVYVGSDSTIRLISPGGVVKTIVGTTGSVGVRIGSLPGSLNCPSGFWIDTSSGVHVLVTDCQENAVLQITPP